jgi:hypothetical protein
MDLAGALEAQRAGRKSLSIKPKLSHIEVVHHLEGPGEPMTSLVEPGKMAEHMASCAHCGGAAPAPEGQ